ncbi:MAG: arsenic resistance N-acetyltransferase ArsN2 [Meiothermus sp.]|nr:arsenic resistance N-acetyltransferase ArsN2 [Meiothermus sp.]
MITFCTATTADLPEVLDLLRRAKLPLAGVEEHLNNFVLAMEMSEQGETLVGCAGLEIHGSAGLLRSVAVEAQYRSEGLGAKLTEGMLELAQHKDLSSVSLLTESAKDYFPRFGFVQVERSKLPESLQQSAELKGACPDSAVAMTLKI